MNREQAEFVNDLCEKADITWSKLHVEYQKRYVEPEMWYKSTSGYQKDLPLPHGSMIEGNELCKEAQKILNKI